MGKGFWLDLPFLFDSVHVDPVSELFFPDIFSSPALVVDEIGGERTVLLHPWPSRGDQGICDLLWERSTDRYHEVGCRNKIPRLPFENSRRFPKLGFRA